MRLAVAGLGFMGTVHLKALRSIPSVQVAAVISLNESKLSGDLPVAGNFDAGAETFDFTGVRKYRNLDDALNDSEIDAVDICLPTHFHESAAIATLNAGKHALVEKPMALSYDACRRMIEAAHRARRVLMAAQVLRFFPAYRALVQALPEIGETHSATLRRRCAQPEWAGWQRDSEKSGGAVLDLLIHDLDMTLHLFGAPLAVRATGRVEPGIDIVQADLLYPTFSVQVVGGWHTGKFPLSMKYRAIGDRGTIQYDFNRYPPRFERGGVVTDLPLDSSDGYAAEIAYFAECVRNGAEPAACRPEESAEAVRLACAVIESRKRNGEKIPWKSG